MGKKNASASASASASVSSPKVDIAVSTIPTEDQGSLASDPLPSVKVNPAHLQEIKSALDDAVKKVSPTVPHMHRQ